MNAILHLALCAAAVMCACAQCGVHHDWQVLLQSTLEKKKVPSSVLHNSSSVTSHSTDTKQWFKNQVKGLIQWVNSTATIQQLTFMSQFRSWMEKVGDVPGSIAEINDKVEHLVESKHENWIHCTEENNECHCNSGMARYGANGRWAYKNMSSSFYCSNSYFDKDPYEGGVKACHCYAYSNLLRCKDGAEVKWDRCAAGSRAAANKAEKANHAEYFCQEGCAQALKIGDKSKNAAKLCTTGQRNEPIFSCSDYVSRIPKKGSPYYTHQKILNKAIQKLCSSEHTKDQLDVTLDCAFKDNFLRWSRDGWLNESYVTYAAGKKNSHFEWMATNLVRSVQLFSTRPVVVVLFDQIFTPPTAWQQFPNVIVLRMEKGHNMVSFNFNKIRAMIGARVGTGIELDLDQIIAPGMDNVFAGTQRESTSAYPYPIMPVHWMSRDAVGDEPYHEYRFTAYSGKHTMRWNHAHPTWTHWALPFLSDMLIQRFAHEHSYTVWMLEDEDMMNVMLWQKGVDKAWCKFDLEPDLFTEPNHETSMYWDSKWYPTGLPILFYSTHNSKEIESTDRLLTLFTRCNDVKYQVSPTECVGQPHKLDSWRLHKGRAAFFEKYPMKAAASECCYVKKRMATPAFWQGKWYRSDAQLPIRNTMNKTRRCIMP